MLIFMRALIFIHIIMLSSGGGSFFFGHPNNAHRQKVLEF